MVWHLTVVVTVQSQTAEVTEKVVRKLQNVLEYFFNTETSRKLLKIF